MKSGTVRVDIAAALAYIERHSCEGLSLGRLVKETQRVTQRVFVREFRAVTGITVRSAILRRQLDEARRLLTGTELSFAFIAGHCGFRNLRGLEKALSSADGQTPAELRSGSRLLVSRIPPRPWPKARLLTARRKRF